MTTQRARVAGALAAALALATTQLVTASSGPSLIDSIGTQFINRFAAPLKDLAVALFGTNDKVALQIGIVIVSLLVGAALGRAARRRFAVGAAGIAAFGLLGIAAAIGDPLASTSRAALGALLGVAVGILTLRVLLDADTAPAPPRNTDPTVKEGTRRSFLMLAGAAGVVSVAAAGTAGAIRAGSNGASRIAKLVLPRAKKVTPLPAQQPFEVSGLSPYVTPNADFYRIDTALFVPRIDERNWKLQVKGMVDRPLSLSYDDLLGMDLVEEPITMQCVSNEVGGKLVGNASWLGVPLVDLLDRAGVKKGATQIVGRSVDNFTAGFPTAAARDGRSALVAVGMNGKPLPQDHGFPARLVVAGLYGYVSATKWLKAIELTTLEAVDGYWIPRGWAKEAPIKIASRVDVPRDGETVAAGPVAIAGVAWSPPSGIQRVDVRVDGGPWQQAQLGHVASASTWVQWMLRWNAPVGDHRVEVRAVNGRGEVQTADEAAPAPDGATGYHSRSFRAG